MQNHASKRVIADLAENYMEKLFYFSLKKTGNSTAAEDLTQAIANGWLKYDENTDKTVGAYVYL